MTLLISEPSCALSSKTSTNSRSSWNAAAPIDGRELELAVLAGAAADIEETRALVMAVMDPLVERRLETLTDAADEDRVADEVIRFWLLDFVGHGLGCSLSVQPPPDATEQRMPKTAENVDGARKHLPVVLRRMSGTAAPERPWDGLTRCRDAVRVIKGGAGHGGDHELSQ